MHLLYYSISLNLVMIDCNVKFKQNRRDHVDVAKNMLALGWEAAVWNNVIVGKLTSQNHKLMQSSSQQVVLEPVEVKECVRLRKIVAKDGIDSIKHYNRLTSIIDDVMDIQLNTNNPSSKLYDIIAVCPGNQQVFSHLCKSAPIDLISIDFTHRVPFPTNKALLDEAVARGVFFEIVYTPMLTNATLRKDVMSGTRVLIQFLRGRNIVLSSGVEHCQDVRGPFDAINIGQLLGMSQQQAKDAICKNAQSLIQHGAARKLKHIPVEVLPLHELTRRCDTYASPVHCLSHTVYMGVRSFVSH